MHPYYFLNYVSCWSKTFKGWLAYLAILNHICFSQCTEMQEPTKRHPQQAGDSCTGPKTMAGNEVHTRTWAHSYVRVEDLVTCFGFCPDPPPSRHLSSPISHSLSIGDKEERERKQDILGRQFFAVISCHLHLAISTGMNLFSLFPLLAKLYVFIFYKMQRDTNAVWHTFFDPGQSPFH